MTDEPLKPRRTPMVTRKTLLVAGAVISLGLVMIVMAVVVGALVVKGETDARIKDNNNRIADIKRLTLPRSQIASFKRCRTHPACARAFRSLLRAPVRGLLPDGTARRLNTGPGRTPGQDEGGAAGGSSGEVPSDRADPSPRARVNPPRRSPGRPNRPPRGGGGPQPPTQPRPPVNVDVPGPRICTPLIGVNCD